MISIVSIIGVTNRLFFSMRTFLKGRLMVAVLCPSSSYLPKKIRKCRVTLKNRSTEY
jgi:hypothetical protein